MEQALPGPASGDSVDRRLASLAAARHGVFTRWEALRAGATRGLIEWRVKTSRWESLYPGVYRLEGAPASWHQRLLAACLVAGERALVSHRAAAALWGLPGGNENVLDIGVPAGRRIRRGGVTVHELAGLIDADASVVEAVPVTSPTRTMIDLAGVVSADVLEEALDDSLRRRLTSVRRLRWRLGSLGRRGRAGARALHDLVEARIGGGAVPESVLETRMLRLLRRARLPLPVCQYPIRNHARLVAVVDFAYPNVRLAIEVDGYRWHSGRARWEHDLARRNALTALGWRVIHVTSSDLQHQPDTIIRLIAGALGSAPEP